MTTTTTAEGFTIEPDATYGNRLTVTDPAGRVWTVEFPNASAIVLKSDGFGAPRKRLADVHARWNLADDVLIGAYRRPSEWPAYLHCTYADGAPGVRFDVAHDHKSRAVDYARAVAVAVLTADAGRLARAQGRSMAAASGAQSLRDDAARYRALADRLDAEADRADAGEPYDRSPIEHRFGRDEFKRADDLDRKV